MATKDPTALVRELRKEASKRSITRDDELYRKCKSACLGFLHVEHGDRDPRYNEALDAFNKFEADEIGLDGCLARVQVAVEAAGGQGDSMGFRDSGDTSNPASQERPRT